MSPEMQADYERWLATRRDREAKRVAQTNTFDEAKAQFQRMFAELPENPVIPPELTAEGTRLAEFKKVCPVEFAGKTDRAMLVNPAAFDAVCAWNGRFPGPLAIGPTGTRKTGAAWAAIGALYVRQNIPFAWFPVRKLISEMEKAEEAGEPEVFFRRYAHHPILFVDDLDKVNLQFQSQVSALWAFTDWAYRTHKAVIATTNRERPWWEENLGSTLARRLFEDLHRPVQF